VVEYARAAARPFRADQDIPFPGKSDGLHGAGGLRLVEYAQFRSLFTR
jgi:hypothetical protein